MTKGLLYVCFGKEFDESLAMLTRVTRQSTDLPITILTNRKAPSVIWKEHHNVNFMYFDMKKTDNRQIKTQAAHYSPYENTLLLDADTVIQKKGLNNIFSLLKNIDIVVSPEFKIESNIPTFNIYKRTIEMTKTELPVTVASGGFICFKKSEKVNDFFDLWNKYWHLMGAGREMPSLACALKNSDAKVAFKEGYYAQHHEDKNCIVQHNWNWKKGLWASLRSNIFKRFGAINPKSDKSFDINDNQDWKLLKCYEPE